MSKKTETGRNPSQPELQSLKSERQVEAALVAYRQGHPDIYIKFWKGLREKATESKGDMTGVNKCSFSHKNPQVQQIPREDLVNLDYAVIEQRVTAMYPAFAAPYGQTEKDQSDDQ